MSLLIEQWHRIFIMPHHTHKNAASIPGASAHGPGGLLATPGLTSPRATRKWGSRRKAQQIAGNLYRGNDGKFQRGGADRAAPAVARGTALSARPTPTTPTRSAPKTGRGGRGGKGRRSGGAARSVEQRQAERQAARSQQQQANRASVASALAEADASLGPTGVASVLAAMDGQPITTGPALETLGYAEQNPDGSYRLTPEARALARAASAGDARAALDADGRAQTRAAKLAAEKKKKLEEKKPKGGGGGKAKPDKAAAAAANRASVGKQLGLNLDALNTAATGGRVSDADRAALTTRGLLADDGQPTDAAQKLLAAADTGDTRAAQAALVSQTRQAARATERRDQQAARDADRAQRRADTAGRRAETDRRRAAADRRQLRAERRAAARAESARLGLRKRRKEAFTVYKAADGTSRWLARSTTAYRDRDGEILSVAALDADSQRMTATKQYGPLRWWHVGLPDAGHPAAPWGPGLDLGWCDFSTVIGRTRVESGTFKSTAIARAVARVADTLELSPGFFHPPAQPDAGGVFAQIRTFERSLVPTRYARASNLFTGLTVKEHRMDPNEIDKRFKAAITELGLSADQAAQLGQQIAQTDKAAQAAGIAYKSQDAPMVYTGPDGVPGIIRDGLFVALKAAGPPMPPTAPAALPAIEQKAPGGEAAEDPAQEGTAEDLAQDTGDFLGDMTVADFEAMLGSAFTSALAPLLKSLDIAGKMAGHVEEMKSMLGGVATKEAGTAAEITALKARLAMLEGDVPAVQLGAEALAALKSAGPTVPSPSPPPDAPVFDPNNPIAGIAAGIFPELYGPRVA